MTREEASFYLANMDRKYMEEGMSEALDMAIKALEQEPKTDILDKIRAEIEAKCCITVGRENDAAITLHDVFEIIDKYRAESEGKE